MILKHFSANLQRSLQLVWSIVENGFKVILSSYQIFWAFEKGISHSNRDEVQIVFQEREAKLSRPLLMGSILENGLKANFRSYSISRAFQNRIFHFFADFSATKWGKWGKLSKKSKIFKFDGFEATLRSKANVVNLVKCFWSNLELKVWKGHFSVFCKFLSDEVETIFWESEAKRSKLFKSKFGYRKLLRKWF